MKKIFTLISGLALSLSLFAYDGTRLSFSTIGNANNYRFEIDGRKVDMRGNSITLKNLSEGTHNVRIFKERGRGGLFAKKTDLIYASAIFICNGYHTDITLNRFDKVFVDERRIQPQDDWNGDDNYDDDDSWESGYANVMSAKDFDMVKKQISSEWSERNRLNSAKVIVDKCNFTTQQVKELMQLFSFESNRLELAKYAFKKTVDQQNYYQLNDALTFQNSKDELARFVRGR
jgi:hypothetical protein